MTKDTRRLADLVMNAFWYPDAYRPTAGQPATEPSASKMARDYWGRCIKDAAPAVQARFKENMGLFFEAVNRQAQDRDKGITPDIESYIDVRRDTSGCKPVFDLVEYALRIELPDQVVEHPVIKALNQGSNDLVTWSNDVFSYNKEQAVGDTHNMVSILMEHHGMTLQQAIDHVGALCEQTINTFAANKARIPSFGDPQLDKDVAGYVQGLQDWIVGSLHWTFKSERYFGKAGAEVKKHRWVVVKPRIDPKEEATLAKDTFENATFDDGHLRSQPGDGKMSFSFHLIPAALGALVRTAYKSVAQMLHSLARVSAH